MKMSSWIAKMFEHSFEKEWFETYWCFDVHGVIFRPNYRKDHLHAEFYPYAKETLQLLSERPDIILIMSTSSYPSEIEFYNGVLKDNGINFKYINENPEIDSTKGNFGDYSQKYYFNVLFEDKAGFSPDEDWLPVYLLLKYYEEINYKPNALWTTKH
jgi:hypothetical protein